MTRLPEKTASTVARTVAARWSAGRNVRARRASPTRSATRAPARARRWSRSFFARALLGGGERVVARGAVLARPRRHDADEAEVRERLGDVALLVLGHGARLAARPRVGQEAHAREDEAPRRRVRAAVAAAGDGHVADLLDDDADAAPDGRVAQRLAALGGPRLAGAAALVVARPRRAARRERDAALDAGRVAHHERVARRDLDDVPLEVVGAAAAQARLLVRAPEPPLVAARLGLGGAERRRERGVAQHRQRALVELGQALAQQRDAHALPRRRVRDVAHGRAAGRAVGRRREAHDDLAVQQPRLDEVLGLERERLRRRRRRRAAPARRRPPARRARGRSGRPRGARRRPPCRRAARPRGRRTRGIAGTTRRARARRARAATSPPARPRRSPSTGRAASRRRPRACAPSPAARASASAARSASSSPPPPLAGACARHHPARASRSASDSGSPAPVLSHAAPNDRPAASPSTRKLTALPSASLRRKSRAAQAKGSSTAFEPLASRGAATPLSVSWSSGGGPAAARPTSSSVSPDVTPLTVAKPEVMVFLLVGLVAEQSSSELPPL